MLWPRGRAAVWTLLAVLGSVMLLVRIHDYGLLGRDTMACVAASRVESVGDFVDTFTERLMTTHNFYRPLLNLTIAWDHALWGLEATGYHVTSALFFALCALSVGLLLQRLLGDRARVGPTLGVAAFVLFPLHLEVVPVVPRRGELMVCAFTMLALWTQLSPGNLERRRPPLVPALWMLTAMGSKDSGMVLWPLCPLAVLLYSPRGAFAARLRHALVSGLPHVVAFVGFFLVRSGIVRGLGGNQELDTFANLLEYPRRLVSLMGYALRPELGESTPLAGALAVGAAAGAGSMLLVALVARREPAGDARAERRGAALRAGAIGLTWLTLMTLTYSFRDVWRSWYVLLLLGGWVLVLGAAGELSASFVAGRGNALRAVGAAGIFLLAAQVLYHARSSPILAPSSEWEHQSAAVDALYTELDRRVDAAAPGSLVEVPRLDAEGGTGVRDVNRNALMAWMKLTHPDVRFRVQPPGSARVRRGDELVLVYRDW